MKHISIIGGGSSAHTLIPTLSKSGFKVNILTSQPEKWNKSVKTEYVAPSGDVKWSIEGEINIATNDPKTIIPNSEIIILCMPVHKYREALHNIAPFINNKRKVFVGTIYGQGGFNWMVEEIKNKFKLMNLTTFAIGLIPWICRIREYGKTGITYGAKKCNVIAMDNKDDFEYLNNAFLFHLSEKWFQYGKFNLSENFISLTLSVDNQLIHTSRLYDLSQESGGAWQKKEDIPMFYADYTNSSAVLLEQLDSDYELIRDAIKDVNPSNNYQYMLGYLALERFSYKSASEDILDSFLNSKTLGQIQTPVSIENNLFVIDKNHRFFHDDIYYGLVIAKYIAEKFEVEVKTIDKILEWAQEILNDQIIKDGILLINENEFSFKTGITYSRGYLTDLKLVE